MRKSNTHLHYDVDMVHGQIGDILYYMNQDNLDSWKTQDEQLQDWFELLYDHTDSGNINIVHGQIEDTLRYMTEDNKDRWAISKDQFEEWRELLINS